MRQQKEYTLCKAIATYLRLQYPKVIFHYDLAGLNLSRAQAGMTKMIQGGKGWPDLFIAFSNRNYLGLFIELKAEGTELYKKDGSFKTPHIAEQFEMLRNLKDSGYMAKFACGFDEARTMIDWYLNL